MFSGTLLGVFIFALISGLFFVSVPIEVFYVNFLLQGGNPWLIMITAFSGFFISYSANYVMGYYMSGVSRKLLSAKQFYKVKIFLNRFGKLAIFSGNLLPFLPSQVLHFTCGVFKYNFARLTMLWAAGWAINLLSITSFIVFFS